MQDGEHACKTAACQWRPTGMKECRCADIRRKHRTVKHGLVTWQDITITFFITTGYTREQMEACRRYFHPTGLLMARAFFGQVLPQLFPIGFIVFTATAGYSKSILI